MRTFLDIAYAPFGETKLDVYLPEGDSFPVFVYLHGGRLERGDKSVASYFAPYMTAHGIAVISVNYRMYPAAKYPEFIEDAAKAVAWTKEHIRAYGKCEGIFVGGSSAGAYLSMMLCFDKSYLGRYGIDPASLSGYFHAAGQPTSHFNVLNERGKDSRRAIVDEAAPLYYVGTEPFYAPMHFVVSDNDMECRYEQTMLMLATLKHFRYDEKKISHTVMHGQHCAYVRASDENGDSVFGQMVHAFIETVLAQ